MPKLLTSNYIRPHMHAYTHFPLDVVCPFTALTQKSIADTGHHPIRHRQDCNFLLHFALTQFSERAQW